METAKLKKADIAVMRGSFLFNRVSDSFFEDVLSKKEYYVRSYDAKERVFDGGDYEKAVGVVLSGSVFVSAPDKKGKGMVLNRLSKGAPFGFASLFSDGDDYVTCITASRPSRIVFFPEAMVCRLISENPDCAVGCVSFLSDRVRFLNEKVHSLSASSAVQRVAFYLQTLETDDAEIKLTELARRLNIGRASLYRAIDALSDAGIIRKSGKHINIIDRDKLVERSKSK